MTNKEIEKAEIENIEEISQEELMNLEGNENSGNISQDEFLANNPDFEITKEEEIQAKQNEAIEYSKRKKKINEIEKISQLANHDIERAIIYVGIQHYSDSFSEFVTENGLKSIHFISPTGKYLFDMAYDIFNDKGKVDFLLLKAELEKQTDQSKKEQKGLSIKNFLNFQGFIPKKELSYNYIQILIKNKSKNDFNELSLNLNKAIVNNDEPNITYYQGEIANFEFYDGENGDNPEIGLISNKYLSEQSSEYINGGYKTSKTILKTGFKNLDDGIGGIERGNFVVFAARPSVGKSVTMLSLMESMERQGLTGLYVSAEMYGRYIYSRWLSIKLNISNEKLKNPEKMSKKEKARWEKYNTEFANNDVSHMYFNSIITAREIEEVARKIKNKTGKLDAIFVDYIGKMYPNNLDMNRNRTTIVGDISRELFNLCSKLDVVVITASQLSRGSSKDAEIQSMVTPKMTDLRDSGDIEQDADMIIGLTRNVPEAETCYTEDDKQDFIWHVIKNRNGKIGQYNFDYHPTTFRLVDHVDGFYKDVDNTQESLAKRTDKKAQEDAINELLKEEDGSNFINATDSIFNSDKDK